MVKNLLKKEIKLNASVQFLIWFILAPFFEFIPNYPRYIGPFYFTVAALMCFTWGLQNRDMLYTVTLPVKRNDVVLARCIFLASCEIAILILSVIFGLIAEYIYPSNMFEAGIHTNTAFAGLTMILYSAFNIVFIANIYRKPEKPTLLWFGGFGAYIALMLLFEAPVWSFIGFWKKTGLTIKPNAKWYELISIGRYLYFNTKTANINQIPVLAAGIVIFIVTWVLTYKVACRHFKKYNF